MDNIEYWIWLQQALGAGSPKPDRLLCEFGGIENVYKAGQADYIKTGFLNRNEIIKLCDKSLSKCETIVDSCLKKGYSVLSADQMPQRLRDIYAPPCVLYMWGSLPRNGESLYISMVGTRNVTAYGTEAATKIAAGLANCGAVVVSGLAVGIDAASHKGTLKSGGKTVAVIGCGLNINYPAENSELKRLIAQNGAVLSEYPPEARPTRANFPIRNRIIAGLSQGTVVVEAGKRSGALITATLAAEMGRDVFAVPGSIFSSMSEGTNSLLRDGAKPVCTVADIIEEYVGLYPQSIIQNEDRKNGSEQLSFDKIGTGFEKKTDSAEQGKIVTKKFTESKIQKNKINYSSKEQGKNAAEKPYANLPAAGVNSNYKEKLNSAEHGESIAEKPYTNLPAAGVSSYNKEKFNSAEYGKSIAEKPYTNLPAAGGNLSEKQLKIYKILNENPQHVDDIALLANVEVRKVLATLTTLEIEGYIKSYPGKRYSVLIKK